MSDQSTLRLYPEPRRETVELLFRTFGDVLIPLETIRARYFRALNEDSFREQLKKGRIQLPLTTLDDSNKASRFIHVHHLAALIDARAWQADEAMARRPAGADTGGTAP